MNSARAPRLWVVAVSLPLLGFLAFAQAPSGAPTAAPQAGQQPAPPAGQGQAGRGGAPPTGGTLSSTRNDGADFSPKPPVKARTPEEEAKSFTLPPGYRMELVVA